MKLDELRKIIREEVRSAVKDEIQDMLTEAVKVASAPTKMQPAPKAGNTAWSAPKVSTPNVFQGDPIMEMISQTKNQMTNDDYKNVINMDSSMVTKPNFAQTQASQMSMIDPGNMPGLDLSKLDFLSTAKKVLDAANEKDKIRKGL